MRRPDVVLAGRFVGRSVVWAGLPPTRIQTVALPSPGSVLPPAQAHRSVIASLRIYARCSSSVSTCRRLSPCDCNRPNHALERTADRREDLLSMTSTLKSEAQLAVVSG